MVIAAQIKTIFRDESKHHVIFVNAIAAEHSPRFHFAKRLKQIEQGIDKGRHETWTFEGELAARRHFQRKLHGMWNGARHEAQTFNGALRFTRKRDDE